MAALTLTESEHESSVNGVRYALLERVTLLRVRPGHRTLVAAAALS